MKKQLLSALFVLSLGLPGQISAQVDLSRATYIGVEQWRDTVNALPGVDRQIVSQDIGALNLSVAGPLRPRPAVAGGVPGGAAGGEAEHLRHRTAACRQVKQAALEEFNACIRRRRTSSSRGRGLW